MDSRTKIIRYSENPFLENMEIPVKGKSVKLSRLGKDDNVLMNQATGEITGTHVTTYRSVDSEQFVKLFTANIALTFDLKAAGIKAFNVLLWVMQDTSTNKDLVPMDSLVLEDFLAAQDKKLSLSIATFGRGLRELEDSQIIAKHVRQGWYYINPSFVFNGDRIAFTTLIDRGDKR